MKKITKALCLFLFMGCLTSCQIISLVIDLTDKEEARILLKDGTELKGRAKMPNSNTKNIRIKTEDGKKHKISGKDIEVLCLWKKKHPEKEHFLYYNAYMGNKLFSTKKKKEYKPAWMAGEAVGDHLNIFVCGYDYKIIKDGTMNIISVQNGSIIYVAQKTGDELGVFIGTTDGGKSILRKNLTEYLNDDPVLCKKLENKEIESDEFQKIVDTYNPNR